MKTFTITEDHLKLLRRFNVTWDDCETGAPVIDQKRPYGNSNVANDIHQILTGERIGSLNSARGELSEAERERYLSLHREMETVLQIVLATGRFGVGLYQQEKKYDYRSWIASGPVIETAELQGMRNAAKLV